MEFVELAKLGAYGVTIALMVMAFRWNSVLTKTAKGLSIDRIKALTSQARWTMVIAGVTFVLAAGVELVKVWSLPREVGVQVEPHDLEKISHQLALLAGVAEPIRIGVAGAPAPILIKDGTGQVSLASGNTLSVDIHEIMTAMQLADARDQGARALLEGKAGATEPSP